MTRALIHLAEVDLGRQRSPEHEHGNSMVKYLRSANVGDGVILLDDVKEMNFTPKEQATFGLRDGDVLVTEGSGSRDTVGQSAVWHEDVPGVVCFQNTLLRIRPRVGLADGRYLAWWARHAHAARLMAAVASGANILHLSAEELRRLPVPDLDLARQHRIADFLDDQVARIDNIIAARRQQIAMIKTMARSQLQALFDGSSALTRPLATLTDARRPIQYGIVLPGPDFPGGVPIVKGGDIAAGRVRSGQLNRTDPEIESRYARSRLRGGDLVISIRGSVGEVDVVPDALTGANLTQDAARIAPFGCDPDWLRWALELPAVQSDMRRRITGAMVPGINIEALRAVRIPDTPPARQLGVGKAAEQVMQATRRNIEGLDRSNSLMQELKRSLISAAVTGEFDVASADGSRVPL